MGSRFFTSGVSETGWVSTVAEGIKLAKEQNKPIMLVIHRHWCKACKILMPIIRTNKEVTEMNKNFVIVEMTGDNDKEEENYAPDGLYVPR